MSWDSFSLNAFYSSFPPEPLQAVNNNPQGTQQPDSVEVPFIDTFTLFTSATSYSPNAGSSQPLPNYSVSHLNLPSLSANQPLALPISKEINPTLEKTDPDTITKIINFAQKNIYNIAGTMTEDKHRETWNLIDNAKSVLSLAISEPDKIELTTIDKALNDLKNINHIFNVNTPLHPHKKTNYLCYSNLIYNYTFILHYALSFQRDHILEINKIQKKTRFINNKCNKVSSKNAETMRLSLENSGLTEELKNKNSNHALFIADINKVTNTYLEQLKNEFKENGVEIFNIFTKKFGKFEDYIVSLFFKADETNSSRSIQEYVLQTTPSTPPQSYPKLYSWVLRPPTSYKRDKPESEVSPPPSPKYSRYNDKNEDI